MCSTIFAHQNTRLNKCCVCTEHQCIVFSKQAGPQPSPTTALTRKYFSQKLKLPSVTLRREPTRKTNSSSSMFEQQLLAHATCFHQFLQFWLRALRLACHQPSDATLRSTSKQPRAHTKTGSRFAVKSWPWRERMTQRPRIPRMQNQHAKTKPCELLRELLRRLQQGANVCSSLFQANQLTP